MSVYLKQMDFGSLGHLIVRLWCKMFHIWCPPLTEDYIDSDYDRFFCPLCQQTRFKLNSNVNYWSKLLDI